MKKDDDDNIVLKELNVLLKYSKKSLRLIKDKRFAREFFDVITNTEIKMKKLSKEITEKQTNF